MDEATYSRHVPWQKMLTNVSYKSSFVLFSFYPADDVLYLNDVNDEGDNDDVDGGEFVVVEDSGQDAQICDALDEYACKNGQECILEVWGIGYFSLFLN